MSQLGNFHLIKLFVDAEVKTQLHFTPKIVEEYAELLRKFSAVHAKYGDAWVTLKLMEPDSQDLAVTNMQNLNRAAWVYAIMHSGNANSIANLKGHHHQATAYARMCMYTAKGDNMGRVAIAPAFRALLHIPEDFDVMNPENFKLDEGAREAWQGFVDRQMAERR